MTLLRFLNINNLRKSIKLKLLVLVAVPIISFILFTVFYIIPSTKDSIYTEKETQTREMVNIALSILQHNHQLSLQGKLSTPEAKENAIAAIKAIRFGDLKQDYFWINDHQPKMIMHPFKPELEGQELSNIKDPDGLALFSEMVLVVEDNGAGFVPYQWQYYDDKNRVEPKLSYVADFEPWGWIIGTGVYVNDIDTVINQKRNTTLIFLLSVTGVALIVLFSLGQIVFVAPIQKLVSLMNLIGQGDFTQRIRINTDDEIGQLSKSINNMTTSLKGLLDSAMSTAGKVSGSSQSLNAVAQEINASLQQVASTANDFAHNAQQLNNNSQNLHEVSLNISTNAGQGELAINNAVTQITKIKDMVEGMREVVAAVDYQSQEVGKIVGTIKGLADQTNLLALNAAIEAARAGEHGRGFSIVAEEVRKLAEKSANAASEITGLITETQKQSKLAVQNIDLGIHEVKQGTEVILATGEVFRIIVEGVKEVTKEVEVLAQASENIGSGSQEVSAVVEEQSATMDDVSNMAYELNVTVEKLSEELDKFKF